MKKIKSLKKVILKNPPQASVSQRKPMKRIFANSIDAARYYEEVGEWGLAANAWKEHLLKCGHDSSSYISDTIEYAYAMVKAFEKMGGDSSLNRMPIKNAVKEVLTVIAKGESFTSGRPALFKVFDLFLMEEKKFLVPEFFILTGTNLDEDTELRDKFLSEFLRLNNTYSWVWNDDITRQRIGIFNDVIIDYCTRNTEKEHINLFYSIKRYTAECLAQGITPSVTYMRSIISSYKSLPLNFEPVAIPSDISKLSAFLNHSIVDIAASLAFFHPSVLLNIAETTNNDIAFESLIIKFKYYKPNYCMITKLGYPMGGGESFMHQSCAILCEFGFENKWVSFTNKDGIPYDNDSIVQTPYYIDIRVAGGLHESLINEAIRNHAADIIHTQGESNELVVKSAKKLRIPCLAGFHFWNGLVKLGFTANRNIMKNAELHKAAETVAPDHDTISYVASEFMTDVYRASGGLNRLEVFHPIPAPSHYGITKSEREGAKFITQINLNEGKGGEIFLACVENLGLEGIPFLGVHSESVEIELLADISNAIKNAPSSRLETYGPANFIYARSKIVIVPTLVDETFCRVAFEAAANGIPVLSTRAGFIPYLLGETGFYLPDDETNDWIDALKSLYSDSAKIDEIGRRQQEYVLRKFGKYPAAFIDSVISIASSKICRKNIGFYTSWSDQGLGYQVRQYCHLLREAGFKTHVFSFLPYKAIGLSLKNQRNENDWDPPRHTDSVYYSYNDRENVPISEIKQFVMANRVGVFIYPEICWDVNWNTIRSLSVPNLFVFGVPNLEIVRKLEAPIHDTLLYKTLCPTRAVENILYSHGVRNSHFIGHGFGRSISESYIAQKISQLQKREFIHFLHIGGHNPKSRKQTPYVIEAFLIALQKRCDIRLTVTVMDTQSIDFPQHENIDYIIESLSHDEVMDLYGSCDVSIQVSSHEGVGMGFYESLAKATPIISLDVPPHNEVVINKLTGWLINAKLIPLPDNDDPVSRAACFDANELAYLIVSLKKEEVSTMIRSAAKIHHERFNNNALKLRLLEGML
jgi:glycosyltransferase involved in cell wall biosynthesis